MSFFGALFSQKNSGSKPAGNPLKPLNPEITLSVRAMRDDLVEMGLQEPEKHTRSVPSRPVITPNPFVNQPTDQIASIPEHTTKQELESLKKIWDERGSFAQKKSVSLPVVPDSLLMPGLSSISQPTIVSSRSKSQTTPSEVPQPDSLANHPSPTLHFPRWFIGVGLVVFILTLLGGGWYWKQLFSPSVTTQNPDVNPSPISQPPNPVASQPPSVYKTSGLNELSFDTKTVTTGQIQSALTSAGQKIKDSGIQQPIAFQITDEQHNPVSFFIFTKWFSLGLMPEIIASLDETFTLYLYNDSGTVHVGLDTKSKDVTQTTVLLSKDEPTLAKSMATLFLNDKVLPPANAQFGSGSYNGTATRYFNFSIPEPPSSASFSLDYAVVNQHLIMATSKQTNRAIMDTVSALPRNK